jgi:hypothetical protein
MAAHEGITVQPDDVGNLDTGPIRIHGADGSRSPKFHGID